MFAVEVSKDCSADEAWPGPRPFRLGGRGRKQLFRRTDLRNYLNAVARRARPAMSDEEKGLLSNPPADEPLLRPTAEPSSPSAGATATATFHVTVPAQAAAVVQQVLAKVGDTIGALLRSTTPSVLPARKVTSSPEASVSSWAATGAGGEVSGRSNVGRGGGIAETRFERFRAANGQARRGRQAEAGPQSKQGSQQEQAPSQVS